jgi:hypothetical protein
MDYDWQISFGGKLIRGFKNPTPHLKLDNSNTEIMILDSVFQGVFKNVLWKYAHSWLSGGIFWWNGSYLSVVWTKSLLPQLKMCIFSTVFS